MWYKSLILIRSVLMKLFVLVSFVCSFLTICEGSENEIDKLVPKRLAICTEELEQITQSNVQMNISSKTTNRKRKESYF